MTENREQSLLAFIMLVHKDVMPGVRLPQHTAEDCKSQVSLQGHSSAWNPQDGMLDIGEASPPLEAVAGLPLLLAFADRLLDLLSARAGSSSCSLKGLQAEVLKPSLASS